MIEALNEASNIIRQYRHSNMASCELAEKIHQYYLEQFVRWLIKNDVGTDSFLCMIKREELQSLLQQEGK